jgi:hypothetical protein
MGFGDHEAEGSSAPAPTRSQTGRLHRGKIRPWQRQQNTDPAKHKPETVMKTELGNDGDFRSGGLHPAGESVTEKRVGTLCRTQEPKRRSAPKQNTVLMGRTRRAQSAGTPKTSHGRTDLGWQRKPNSMKGTGTGIQPSIDTTVPRPSKLRKITPWQKIKWETRP